MSINWICYAVMNKTINSGNMHQICSSLELAYEWNKNLEWNFNWKSATIQNNWMLCFVVALDIKTKIKTKSQNGVLYAIFAGVLSGNPVRWSYQTNFHGMNITLNSHYAAMLCQLVSHIVLHSISALDSSRV